MKSSLIKFGDEAKSTLDLQGSGKQRSGLATDSALMMLLMAKLKLHN
jgi:hypothetical protein